jgi:hypothetical protein
MLILQDSYGFNQRESSGGSAVAVEFSEQAGGAAQAFFHRVRFDRGSEATLQGSTRKLRVEKQH